ncbi:MAG: nicotinate phosphoribosyltransferase [Gammaproteobacteria bacterium]|nr:nicotinate phosphoribosyltransferase [Gammaproteobacteria bacterium]
MTNASADGRANLALLTDLYELTMADAYLALGMHEPAVFELFVRRLPPHRSFLVAAGLDAALDYLENLRFDAADLDYLATLGLFPERFLAYLAALRFTGTVHALPEGTVFYEQEPILRVTAPIIEAQLVESRLMNLVHFATLIASKAARCVLAARGRRLIDFGMRRAHGAEAALLAARSAYLAGFDATATVEAGRRWGIPAAGTMAHSFVQAHASEAEAFSAFLRARPGRTTLLIDTYDTRQAAHTVVAIARELAARGEAGRIEAVRIDSGDLDAETRAVRAILDAGGCGDVKIVLSGGIDEHQIEALVSGGVPVDAFGIGTSLDVSSDAPALDIAYKLQEYAGQPRRKRSVGKATWPGRKQVWRRRDTDGRMTGDTVALEHEALPGEALLIEVMRDGRRRGPSPDLAASRARCRAELAALPPALCGPAAAACYPVMLSAGVTVSVTPVLPVATAAQGRTELP